MDFTLVIALSAAVERFTEVIKPLIANLKLSDDTYKAVIQLVGVVAGIAMALLANGSVNLFTGYSQIPQLVGIVLTGVIAGLGSAGVHVFLDLLYGWKDNVTMPTATVTETTTSSLSASSPLVQTPPATP